MLYVSRFLVRPFLLCAFAILIGSVAVSSTVAAADEAFAVIRDAFERIRGDYVDEIEDARLFRSAVLGMVGVPNVSPGLLEDERVRRAITVGASSRNPDVIVRLLQAVFDEIRTMHPNTVREDVLIDGAVQGMIDELDPHCEYVDAQRWRANLASLKTGSIGLNVTMTAGRIRVVGPVQNGPAERTGIVAGDVVVAINGAPVAGRSLEQVVAMSRGALDTEVVLTIERENKRLDIKIVRARVIQESVRFRRYGKIGYVQIVRFNEQTAANFRSAVAALQSDADKPRGYVIDLRNNSGGLLEQAAAITEMLLGQGPIATTRSREDREMQRFDARADDVTGGASLVVLIDGKTAAGAEIMAAALHEQRRATIVGTPSSGSGTIQTIIPLRGDRGALRLTTARIHLASGRALDGAGVMPDIMIEQAPSQKDEPASNQSNAASDGQLQLALKVLSASRQ